MSRRELIENLIQNQIGGYEFVNPKLLRQAFTRKSYTEEKGGQNNEVLEFIGDKVLDIAVIRFLVAKYGSDMQIQEKIPTAFRVPQEPQEFSCSKTEGELTRIKQRLVEKKILAERIDALGLAEYLVMGKGDIKSNLAKEDSVKEDLFEAILGAVALDCNWDFEILQNVVEIMLCPDSYINNEEETDYVGLIYQWDEARGCLPWFKYFNGTAQYLYGRDASVIYKNQGMYVLNHAKYECQVRIHNTLPTFGAVGLSKNEARREACEMAYLYLKDKGMLPTIRDEIDNPSLEMSINQLEILARRRYFSVPDYSYEESHDEDGDPIWRVECHIKEYEAFFSAEAPSKKQAKKNAAWSMLQYILESQSAVK